MSDETLNPGQGIPSGDPVEETPSGDLNDVEQTTKDRSYSPSSAVETEELQNAGGDSPALDDPDIDNDNVTLLPGTGGPDDVGDIDVDPGEIDMSGNAGKPHTD
ncbi:hypothetical protein [Mycetocola zhujimingii]|uniref:Uncharacterized protein n=1 Tax=Mycetocola zhujimingii TaxID=2079792 RepID=A0A2U1TB66_9MICO|nr:hypothetical protein [Mycetocola zhujimingii]PWC06050.1 hypothetical protein DF223_13540 [Mycetocola zhujimingii]